MATDDDNDDNDGDDDDDDDDDNADFKSTYEPVLGDMFKFDTESVLLFGWCLLFLLLNPVFAQQWFCTSDSSSLALQ